MVGVMIQTAFLVIAILAVRKVLGSKLHAYVRYGLWLIVALRLLVPVNMIESPLSMLSVAKVIQLSDAARQNSDLQGADSAKQTDAITNTITEQQLSPGNVLQSANAGFDKANVPTVENVENIVADAAQSKDAERIQSEANEGYLPRVSDKVWHGIWLAGSLLVGGFLGFSHFRFYRRLCRTRAIYTKKMPSEIKRTRVPVYRVKELETPCLVGLIRPAIYIGTDIDTLSDHFRYAVAHEEVHYLHRDYIWSVLRAVLVAVYWFHPFVWIAAVCSAGDGEIACDYGTVRRFGKEEQLAYGEMLLALSKRKSRKRVYSYGTMLRPSRSELKERIVRLAKIGGNRAWAGILAAMLMVVIAGCALTGAPDINDSNVILLTNEAGKDSEDATADDNESPVADSGDAPDENIESDAKENMPDSEDIDMMEPSQLEAVQAAISGDTLCGVDGPWLDYAGGMGTDKGSRIIFHDYFGLIVYDFDNRTVVRSLALEPIGCDKTQGDDACQVAVSEDGATVWLHPMSKRYMYRYEVEENLLYREPLVKTFELDLENKDLFNRYSTSEEGNTDWHSNYLYEEYQDEQGLHQAYIYLTFFSYNIDELTDYKLMLRNLACVWDDMVLTLFEESAEVPDDAEASEDVSHDEDGRFPYNYHGNVVDEEIIYDKPCNYNRISDTFGERVHPISGEVILHEGIDYAAAEGTDIWAAADGVVYETGFSAKYGNYAVLRHANGDMTYYCQCKEVTVKKDDQVKRGDKIGTVGQTGQATGPHLHFALSRHGWFEDPAKHMEMVLELD